MTHARCIIPILAIVSLVTGACASEPGAVDPVAQEPVTASLPPHEREPATSVPGERELGDGEESGAELSLDADYDQVRNGARLVLSYDPIARAFTGTVENTTERTLRDIRVEVHLSNGTELGPTIPIDLQPGSSQPVSLASYSAVFDGWSAHQEVGRDEHPGEPTGEGEGGEDHAAHEDGDEHGDRAGRGEHAEHG
jgi:hypothetical protein